MKRLVGAVLAVVLLGCASKAPFDPSTMTAPSPDAETEFTDPLTVKDIESLSPQLSFPMILAVSQPTSGEGWSPDELQLIESWRQPLEASGFIRDLVILPESLSDSCGWRNSYYCGARRYRTAAARFRADALLLVAAETKVKSYANPLSILNLTLVGMWLIPGHHRNATTVLEGSLIDNRNEYLYAFARSYGEANLVRPYVYADWSKARDLSRYRALESFGERMQAEVAQAQLPEAVE